MKKLVLHYINLPLLLGAISMPSYGLEAMNDHELSSTTGEGVGVLVDNLSIHSADKGEPGAFEITLDLSETLGTHQFIFSELRVHKTGTTSGAADSGGSFGTINNPVFLGDLRAVDVFTGTAGDPNDSTVTETTVIRSEFPGAGLRQVDRSTKRQLDNFAAFERDANRFVADLDKVSDRFTAHIRFDDFILNNSAGSDNNFRAMIDIEGLRFYGTYSDIFATEGHGISIAGATGLYIEKLTVSTSLPTAGIGGSIEAAGQAGDYVTTPIDSRLTFNGIDIYTTLGTHNQPMTLDNVKDENGNNQLQLEIAPLPASVGIAPKSDIYVKSLYFGDKYNPEMRTGLRQGKADDGTPENYHYAFQPDVGNTIEIRGMQVQHLRITTMDI